MAVGLKRKSCQIKEQTLLASFRDLGCFGGTNLHQSKRHLPCKEPGTAPLVVVGTLFQPHTRMPYAYSLERPIAQMDYGWDQAVVPTCVKGGKIKYIVLAKL